MTIIRHIRLKDSSHVNEWYCSGIIVTSSNETQHFFLMSSLATKTILSFIVTKVKACQLDKNICSTDHFPLLLKGKLKFEVLLKKFKSINNMVFLVFCDRVNLRYVTEKPWGNLFLSHMATKTNHWTNNFPHCSDFYVFLMSQKNNWIRHRVATSFCYIRTW